MIRSWLQRSAEALVAALALGALYLIAPYKVARVRNDPLDWVRASGAAGPFVEFARRFGSPVSLLAETHLSPQDAVRWQDRTDHSLGFERGLHLSARQMLAVQWPAFAGLESMCGYRVTGWRMNLRTPFTCSAWSPSPSVAAGLWPSVDEITWTEQERHALSGPLNRALHILDAYSHLGRIVIWPELSERPTTDATPVLGARIYGEPVSLLGNGFGSSGLRAAQQGIDRGRWLLLSACAMLAIARTESLVVALLAVLPSLAPLLFAERALGGLGGTSSLASSAGQALSQLLLTLAALRLIRARSSARDGVRQASLCLAGSAALGGVLLLLGLPALRDLGINLALGLALGAGLVLGFVPLLLGAARALGSLGPRRQPAPAWWRAPLGILATVTGVFGFAVIDAKWLHPIRLGDQWPPRTLSERLFESSPLPWGASFLALPALIGWALDLLRSLRQPQRAEPGHRSPGRALVLAGVLLGLAALGQRALLGHALQAVYPEWLTAATTEVSPVEAFELSLDPGEAPLGGPALERVAKLGRELDQLPDAVARLDASLATAEGMSVPPLLSRDGTLSRVTLWVKTKPGRDAPAIAAEIEHLLAQRDWGFRRAVVTGTWQARAGLALDSVALVSWALGLGLSAVFLFCSCSYGRIAIATGY